MSLVDHLEAEISDDLFLAKLSRQHGLRVRFATGALLATPTSRDWKSMFMFGKRQYQMVRIYAPTAYSAALLLAAFNCVGTAVPLICVATTSWGFVAYLSIAALSLLIEEARSRLALAADVPVHVALPQRGIWFIAFGLPIVHFIHLLLIISALHRRTILWGRCKYRMIGRKVLGIERIAEYEF